LHLKCDLLVSIFAFEFNLYRSNEGAAAMMSYKAPEVVLLDGPSEKLPMLAVGDLTLAGGAGGAGSLAGPPGGGGGAGDAAAAGAVGAAVAGAPVNTDAGAAGDGAAVVVGAPGVVAAPQPHSQSIVMNVNGTMRRLQPVCAQALPWSTSFIGCPGGGRGTSSIQLDP
jgi:hypothetical protein